MKWIKYGLAIFVCTTCIICTIKFIKGGKEDKKTSNNRSVSADSVSASPVMKKGDISKSAEKPLTKDEIWKKIANSYIEGETINEASDTVRQDAWTYHINSLQVTKKHAKNWDAVPDYSEYQYDESFNLTNNYSYLAINITVQCKDNDTDHPNDFWLNSMGLKILNSKVERVGSGYAEMATASLGKPRVKSYFHNPLKEGETLTVDIVYIVEDSILENKDLYYVLEINNHGMQPSEPDDIGLIKIPLGVEYENNDKK